MTIKHHNICNVTIAIDRNGYQSDNQCNEIMPIHNLELVLKGFGFDVIVVKDGHNPTHVLRALENAVSSINPQIVIFDTTKANGTNHMKPIIHSETNLLCQPWHTKVPRWPLYMRIVAEQLSLCIGDRREAPSYCYNAIKMWNDHKKQYLRNVTVVAQLPNTHRPSLEGKGTGKAFGNHLSDLILKKKDPRLRVVSCDLATSCGVNKLVGNKQFFELGVAEQNAASFCGGMCLEGKRRSNGACDVIPVFATYSNFLKRCFENIFINCVSGAHCIYFGTYSGLCYHTDGKSHQSFADVRTFSGLPHMIVMDPFSEQQAVDMLDEVLRDGLNCSVFFRLRRTPVPLLESLYDLSKLANQSCSMPLKLAIPKFRENYHEIKASKVIEIVIVTSGTVPTKLGFDCAQTWNFVNVNQSVTKKLKTSSSSSLEMAINVIDLVAVSKIGSGTADELNEILQHKNLDVIVTIEDDVGVLQDIVLASIQGRRSPGPVIVSKTMTEEGPSFRTLEHCLEHHQFTVDGIRDLIVECIQ